MNILQALILGTIQGLTELLPISSSAHLNLFPWIFNWGQMPDSFDVALHIGTLLAILIYFIDDWIELIKCGYTKIVKKEKNKEGEIFWYIVIATIPAGILSIILEKISEKIIKTTANKLNIQEILVEMVLIAISLIIMGIVLYLVDKNSKSDKKYDDITLKQSILISMSQSIAAAFPGVSRSGITITVGRKMHIQREDIAKFSFLLSTPIVFAATIYKLKEFSFDIPFIIGVFSSFIVGIIVIKFFLKYLKNGNFKIFAIYRIILGILILTITFNKF